MNADGSGQRNLTQHPASDNFAAFSPDGRRLAFLSNRDGGYGIYVMDLP
jgi:TolB protein